jgi:flagellar hook assembly protein FlgD
VQLRVFDLAGRLVRTLIDEDIVAGEHAIVWNGLDDHGRQVASGAYYYRLTAPEFSDTQKMVLIK